VLVAACGWCGDILRPSTLLTHAWGCRARGGGVDDTVARDGNNNNNTPLASTAQAGSAVGFELSCMYCSWNFENFYVQSLNGSDQNPTFP
jgi:hypothetical protein